MFTLAGWDDALIGQADVWVTNDAGAMTVERFVYSGNKMVEILMAKGMDEQDAFEFVALSIEGNYMGEDTPVVIWSCSKNDLWTNSLD